MCRHRDTGPLVQIEITLTVPRRLVWLLAAVTIGHLDVLGRIVARVGHVLRMLTG